MGPRGLSALERLCYHVVELDQISITIYETTDMAGYGHVYNTAQPNANWVNISARALDDLKGRTQLTYRSFDIPEFPAFNDSQYSRSEVGHSTENSDIWHYRSTIGKYLKERFQSIINPLLKNGVATVLSNKVDKVNYVDSTIEVITDEGNVDKFDEVLLTIGHQPTTIDDQLSTWLSKAKSNSDILLFTEAYPIRNLQSVIEEGHHTIGLRGFGLAAIDVIRYLVNCIDAKSDVSSNHNLTPQNVSICAFTLDGLAPVPKPLNEKVDNQFAPSKDHLNQISMAISQAIESDVKTHLFLVEVITTITSQLYNRYRKQQGLSDVEGDMAIAKWISEGATDHVLFADKDKDVVAIIKDQVQMARGEQQSSLDYFIGQVWRHIQPTLYDELSHRGFEDDLMAEIISIDERIKRYSYGPPVQSMEYILDCVDRGILSLQFLDNPSLELTEKGWDISNHGNRMTVTAMINTVIDSPKILDVKSALVQSLLADDIIQPVHRDYGIDTTPYGRIVNAEENADLPIYLLGRLAKGSVIGVDAILECFGNRIDAWAEEFSKRVNAEKK